MADFWTNLGVGGYSALNSVGLGLPDFLVKTVNSDAYKQILAEREKNKGVALAGDVVGTLGSLFIPGGAILKGAAGVAKGASLGAGALKAGGIASKLAKAGVGLEKAADIASGAVKIGKTPLAQGAVRGLVGAAEQAVPRMITEGGTTGDYKKALQNAAIGIGAGGAIGGGLGKLGSIGKSQVVQTAAEIAQDKADDAMRAYAGSMGVSPRVVRQNLARFTPGGLNKSNKIDTKEAENLKRLVKFGEENKLASGINRGGRIEKKLSELSNEYDQAYNALEKANPNIGEAILGKVKEKIAGTPGLNEETVKKLASKFDNSKNGLYNVRQQIKADLSKLRRATALTADDVERLDTLNVLDDSIDDLINEASEGRLSELNSSYRSAKQFALSDFFENLKGYSSGSGGSATQARQATEKLLQRAMLGAGVGGGATGAKDLIEGKADTDTLTKMGIAALGGTVLGGAYNAAVPRIAQKLQGVTAKTWQKVADILSKQGDEGAKGLVAIEGAVQKAPQVNVSGAAGAIPTIDKPEAVAVPEVVEEAQEPKEDRFKDYILQKIAKDYQTAGLADQGISFDDFAEYLAEKTDGFDPKKSAKILYPGDEKAQEKYLSDLERAERVKGIDLDLAEKQGFLGIGRAEGAEKELSDLKGVFYSILTNNGEKNLSKDAKAMVDDQLKMIADAKVTPQEKQAMILDLLQGQYGVNVAGLSERGLV